MAIPRYALPSRLKLDKDCDGVIRVNKVDDLLSLSAWWGWTTGIITEFVEKAASVRERLRDLGICSFADGIPPLKMQFLIDNDIKDKGEYQLINPWRT
ncbi:MAG: hypothetical protein IPP33_16645 [Flavobacteriales bacterium]|nr:hypothetical protein [Flavobacteriales bacterium]